MTTTLCLQAEKVTRAVAGTTLLADASVELRPGELIAVLGPNGAGKSTLLQLLTGVHSPSTGHVTLDGIPLATYSSIQRAQKMAYLPQNRDVAWPNNVRDIVSLGRYAWGAAPGKISTADQLAVDQALAACSLEHLADRKINSLSGGEIVRVHCARLYASGAPLLIADEPIASLDPYHQHRVMSLLREYVDAEHGVMVVIHDVNLALRYADRIIWMQAGSVVADTLPAHVDAELVSRIFALPVQLVHAADSRGTGRTQVTFTPPDHTGGQS